MENNQPVKSTNILPSATNLLSTLFNSMENINCMMNNGGEEMVNFNRQIFHQQQQQQQQPQQSYQEPDHEQQQINPYLNNYNYYNGYLPPPPPEQPNQSQYGQSVQSTAQNPSTSTQHQLFNQIQKIQNQQHTDINACFYKNLNNFGLPLNLSSGSTMQQLQHQFNQTQSYLNEYSNYSSAAAAPQSRYYNNPNSYNNNNSNINTNNETTMNYYTNANSAQTASSGNMLLNNNLFYDNYCGSSSQNALVGSNSMTCASSMQPVLSLPLPYVPSSSSSASSTASNYDASNLIECGCNESIHSNLDYNHHNNQQYQCDTPPPIITENSAVATAASAANLNDSLTMSRTSVTPSESLSYLMEGKVNDELNNGKTPLYSGLNDNGSAGNGMNAMTKSPNDTFTNYGGAYSGANYGQQTSIEAASGKSPLYVTPQASNYAKQYTYHSAAATSNLMGSESNMINDQTSQSSSYYLPNEMNSTSSTSNILGYLLNM